MFSGLSKNRIRHVTLLSICLLLGILIGVVLPAQGSTTPTHSSSRVNAASEASLKAIGGYLPSSAHLTLWEEEDTISLPLILR